MTRHWQEMLILLCQLCLIMVLMQTSPAMLTKLLQTWVKKALVLPESVEDAEGGTSPTDRLDQSVEEGPLVTK